MINVSDELKNYINGKSRKFKARILYGSTPITGDIRSLTINKGSCSNSFQPASIFSTYIDVTVDYCNTNISGKKLKVQIGADIDGSTEWTTVATVYASKPVKKIERTTFTGFGVISAKLGKKFKGGTFSTVSSLLSHIEQETGATIILDGLEDLSIPEINLKEYYYKEVLSLVAGLYFGYACETPEGDIVIRSYKKTGENLTAYVSRMLDDPDFYDEATVEGIQITAKDDKEFVEGNIQNCSLTNPLMTEEIFNANKSNFVGFSYTPYEADMTLGDFRIEPIDLVEITARDGVTYSNLRCMNITHTFDGGIKTIISSPNLDDGENYARGSTRKKADTAYDSYVSGDWSSGGSGGGGTS